MRDLHVVGLSDDGRHLVLATGAGATRSYRVPLDDRLRAAVQTGLVPEDVAPSAAAAPVPASPKEIQSRLRAGESVEQIAAASGMPLSKVERYAGPVLSERERVLTQVRNSFVSSTRHGPTALRLGDAVDRRLADTTGVRVETVSWSARREHSGVWLVELGFVSQSRRRKAAWRYDVARREVSAADSTAARLSLAEADGEAVVGAPVAGTGTRTPRTGRSTASRGSASRATTRSGSAGRSSGPSAAAPARTLAGLADPSVAPTERSSRTVAARRNGRPPAEPVVPETALSAATAGAASQRTATARSASPRTASPRTASPRAASARTAADRRTQAVAQRTATAAAARKEQVLAERTAQAVAARRSQVAAVRKARTAAAKDAAEQVEREAQASAARRAEAAEQRKARAAAQRSAAKAAAAERLHEQSVAVHAQAAGGEAPAGPPTLRVVGGGASSRSRPDRRTAPEPGRREGRRGEGPQDPPAVDVTSRPEVDEHRPEGAATSDARHDAGPDRRSAPRSAPARVAGSRASVPAWADVLLSTGPATGSAEPEPGSD